MITQYVLSKGRDLKKTQGGQLGRKGVLWVVGDPKNKQTKTKMEKVLQYINLSMGTKKSLSRVTLFILFILTFPHYVWQWFTQIGFFVLVNHNLSDNYIKWYKLSSFLFFITGKVIEGSYLICSRSVTLHTKMYKKWNTPQ